MTVQEFKASLSEPSGRPQTPYLLALWLDARKEWEEAHAVVQDMDTEEAAHIHAYLHRKEGDNGNARYWYRTAGRNFPDVSLEDEWVLLVKHHLS